MGMYDSFYITKEGIPFEVQTKEFENCLQEWYLGDVVFSLNSVYNPNQVIVEDLYSDDEWVGIVICQGVFMDYVLANNADEAYEKAFNLLNELSSNSNKLNNKILNFLNEKNRKIFLNNYKINNALSKFWDIKDYLEGKDEIFNMNKHRFFSKFREVPEELKAENVAEELKLRYLLESLINDIDKFYIKGEK